MNETINLKIDTSLRLGNNLFIYANAISKAFYTDKIILNLQNNFYLNKINDLFNIHGINNKINQIKKDNKNLSNEKSNLIDDFTSFEYFQSEKCFNAKLIKNVFKIDNDKINNIKLEYSNINFDDSVGIHIRRTDYLSLYNQRLFNSLPAFFYESIYEKHFNGKQCICFSDDIEWCKKNIKIKNIIFINTIDEIHDFIAFSLCHDKICSNSTFSWWASWFNEQIDSKIIFYQNWFYNVNTIEQKFINDNIIPNRWIKSNENIYRTVLNTGIDVSNIWIKINDDYIETDCQIKFNIIDRNENDEFILSDSKNNHYSMYKLDDYKFTINNMSELNCSGIKRVDDIFEYPGVFIDEENKILNFRIAKNASSAICKSFSNVIWGTDKVKEFFFVEELQSPDFYNEYQKFIIFRDPIKRFMSSVSHILNGQWMKNLRFGKKFYDELFFYDEKNKLIKWYIQLIRFLNNYYLSSKYYITEDIHLIPQFLWLKKNYLNKGYQIDTYVDIDNIKDFFFKKLKKEFKYAITVEENKNSVTLNDINPYLNEIYEVLKPEYEFINIIKSKIYNINE